MALLTILHYFIAAGVDVMDKILISRQKIRPLPYAFFTVVTGTLVLIGWPWVYESIPSQYVWLNLFSGAFFSLTLFVFFVALSQGEVSRVVTFIFGLVPVFDIFIDIVMGRNSLAINEFIAMCYLVPGAFLIAQRKGEGIQKHIGLKVLSALLFSSYFALWQLGAQHGPVLNNFMWNRIGAAGIFMLLLLIPYIRKQVFAHSHIENKKQTGVLFAVKQLVGGVNFIFVSWLYVVWKIPVVNALQGFRYVFLFVAGLFMSKKLGHVLTEDTSREVLYDKVLALTLIFFGVIFLFIQ